MNKLSFLEKFKILIEVSKSSYWFLIVIVLFIGFGLFLLKTKEETKKRNQRIYIIFSAIIGLFFLIYYQSSLSHLWDYLMNNLFIKILYPDLAIYFLGVILTNIILWSSLFYYKTSEGIKRINIIVYIILSYLLALTIKVTDIKNIDIYSEISVYENTKTLALVELSSIIFITWILFLIVYKIIMIYLKREYKQKVKKVVITKTIKRVPENYVPTVVPNYIFGNPGRRVSIIDPNPNHLIEDYEKKLTLEDYQLVLKILKEEKKRSLIRSTNIPDKAKIVEMKKEAKQREDEKYTELEMLYRGIQ